MYMYEFQTFICSIKKNGFRTPMTLNPPLPQQNKPQKKNNKNKKIKPSHDFLISDKITPVKALPQNIY